MTDRLLELCFGVGIALLACGSAWAGAWTPEAHTGSATVNYQYSHVHFHLTPTGDKVNAGMIDTQSVYLQLNYGITDRIAVYVGLPWVNKRYIGSGPHRIADADGHIHVTEEDDGSYHGALQDVTLGLQYGFEWGSWSFAPFAAYGTATHDYEYFAHAAIGPRQDKFEVGVEAGRLLAPPLDRMYVQFGYGYSFLEEFADVDISRSTLTLETGYAATDRLILRVFAIGVKTHNGLEFPDDYAYLRGGRTAYDRELFHRHDTTQRIDFIEAGCGASYSLSERTSLFANVYRTFWGEGSHETQIALGFGINRQF